MWRVNPPQYPNTFVSCIHTIPFLKMRLGNLLFLMGASSATAQWQGKCRSFTQAGPPENTVPSNGQPGHCYLVPASQQQNCGNIAVNCPSGGFCYCPIPGIGCMPASTYCCVCSTTWGGLSLEGWEANASIVQQLRDIAGEGYSSGKWRHGMSVLCFRFGGLQFKSSTGCLLYANFGIENFGVMKSTTY